MSMCYINSCCYYICNRKHFGEIIHWLMAHYIMNALSSFKSCESASYKSPILHIHPCMSVLVRGGHVGIWFGYPDTTLINARSVVTRTAVIFSLWPHFPSCFSINHFCTFDTTPQIPWQLATTLSELLLFSKENIADVFFPSLLFKPSWTHLVIIRG